jgi:hypothetical protein
VPSPARRAGAAKEFGVGKSLTVDAGEFVRRFKGELIVMPGVGHTTTPDAIARTRAYLQAQGF